MVETSTNSSGCSEINPMFLLFNNIFLHCLILFIILFGLFKYIIAPLSTNVINEEFIVIINSLLKPELIKEVIQNKKSPEILKAKLIQLLNIDISNTTQVILLNKITEYIANTPTDKISSTFKTLANNFAAYETDLRERRNADVYKKMKLIIVLLIIMAIIINIFPRIFGNKCTGIKHLGIELLVIFSCVGIIEFWFFMNIGKKFVPVMPSVITQTFKDTMIGLVMEPPAPEYISPVKEHHSSGN